MPRMDEMAVLLDDKDGIFYEWQRQLIEDSRGAQETPSAAIAEMLTACQDGRASVGWIPRLPSGAVGRGCGGSKERVSRAWGAQRGRIQ